MTKIVSAFPACGKTYAYGIMDELGYTIADSDSSLFSWIHVDGERVRNPDFPDNYIKHINEMVESGIDFVFVSSHAEVREALDQAGFEYISVMPNGTKATKSEWIRRMVNRGNAAGFVDLIRNNWDSWVVQYNHARVYVNKPILMLSPHEYLSDKLDVIQRDFPSL